MRRYFAEVLEAAIDLACALTNHAGGCWLAYRSPLRRVVWWAVETQMNDHTARGGPRCSMSSTIGHWPRVECEPRNTTALGGTTQTFRVNFGASPG